MATAATDHHNAPVEADAGEHRRWLLAIDTSTDQAGIALFDGEQMAECSWPGGRQQTTSVLPAIESLLAQVGVDLGDVGAVAVATGPGSFTGLRVGLSLAKGFAIAGDRRVIGIPTLDIAAAPYRCSPPGVRCLGSGRSWPGGLVGLSGSRPRQRAREHDVRRILADDCHAS